MKNSTYSNDLIIKRKFVEHVSVVFVFSVLAVIITFPIILDFTSGNGSDNFYTITSVADANTFTVTDASSGTTSGNVTIASAAANTLTYFRIFRDVSDGNDDMAEDARLLGVQIFYTTDAVNDA